MGPAGTPVTSGSRAVLARTNSELVPFAAVALELGIPYQVEDDGLLLGQPALLAAVDARAIAHAGPGGMSLPALARAIHETGLVAETGAALLAWAAPYGRLADLRDELRARASARREAGCPRPRRSARRRADARDLPRHEGPRVGPRGLHRARRGHVPGRARALREAPTRGAPSRRSAAWPTWPGPARGGRSRSSTTRVLPRVFLREAFDPASWPGTGGSAAGDAGTGSAHLAQVDGVVDRGPQLRQRRPTRSRWRARTRRGRPRPTVS